MSWGPGSLSSMKMKWLAVAPIIAALFCVIDGRIRGGR
jgi:hypothetical protein